MLVCIWRFVFAYFPGLCKSVQQFWEIICQYLVNWILTHLTNQQFCTLVFPQEKHLHMCPRKHEWPEEDSANFFQVGKKKKPLAELGNILLHIHNGIMHSNESQWTTAIYNMDQSRWHNVEKKKIPRSQWVAWDLFRKIKNEL